MVQEQPKEPFRDRSRSPQLHRNLRLAV